MIIELKHSMEKIFPTYMPTDRRRISLFGARNEAVSFQVALQSDDKSAVIESVTATFPGKVMVYVQGFMDIKTPSTIEGSTGLHPDILFPDVDEYAGEKRNPFPLRLEGRTRTLWIEVRIPENMTPGIHVLTLKIGDEEVTAEIDVLPFAIPVKPTLATWFQCSYEKLAPGHKLPTSATEELRSIYAIASLRHRVGPDILVYAPKMDAKNVVDFSEVDRIMAPFWDGITSFRIKDHGFNPQAIGRSRAVLYYRRWAKYLEQKGMLDKAFIFPVDEPRTSQQWATIAEVADVIREADPRLRLMATASLQHAAEAGAAHHIDLFCPTIRYMDNKPGGHDIGSVEPPGGAGTIGNQRGRYGNIVWWYQACGSHGCGYLGGGKEDPAKYRTGWPSYMIDLPPIYSRIMSWLTYQYNVQGELYYDMIQSYGQRDPYRDQFLFGGNGDGTLFYPGTPAVIGGTKHVPVESLRLKQIRDGLQDYEYLVLAEERVGRTAVKNEIAPLVTNTYTWSKDASVLMAVRAKLAEIIVGNAPAPTPPPAPTPTSKPIEGVVSIGGEKFNLDGTLKKI